MRVKDIDFERGTLTVRSGKGDKDRVTVLPESLKMELQLHLAGARRIFDQDFRDGRDEGVALPDALERKYPNAGREWAWFWVFPAPAMSDDPRSGKHRRHHIHVSNLQRSFKEAARPGRDRPERLGPFAPSQLRHSSSRKGLRHQDDPELARPQ